MAGIEPSHALLGRRIRLQGLVARPALNDRSGVVVSFDPDKERLGVQLDAVDDKSEAILVKPANVRVGMRTAWDVPSYVDRTFPETDQVLSGSAAQGLAKSLQSLCGNRITIVDVRLLYGQMFTPEVDRWVQDGVASCQGPVPYGEKPRREMLGRGALVFIWVPPEDALAFKAHVIIDGRDTSIAVVWTHIGPYLVPPCYLTAKEQKHVLRAVVYSLMQSAIVERRIYVFLALSEFVRMELLKASELDLCESMLCLQIEAYLALAKTQGDAWTIDATLSCGKLGEYYESRGEFLRAADVYKRAVSHASRKPHMWVPGGPSVVCTHGGPTWVSPSSVLASGVKLKWSTILRNWRSLSTRRRQLKRASTAQQTMSIRYSSGCIEIQSSLRRCRMHFYVRSARVVLSIHSASTSSKAMN